MNVRRRINIYFFCFISLLVSSKLTIGIITGPFCVRGGDCTYGDLTVNNLTVIGDLFNVSVVNYNVTGTLDVDGDIVADTGLFDRIDVGRNGHCTGDIWCSAFDNQADCDGNDCDWVSGVTGRLNVIGNINVTENITADNFYGNLDASYILNEYWVNETGDTMTGDLIITNTMSGVGGEVDEARLSINVDDDTTITGTLDSDGVNVAIASDETVTGELTLTGLAFDVTRTGTNDGYITVYGIQGWGYGRNTNITYGGNFQATGRDGDYYYGVKGQVLTPLGTALEQYGGYFSSEDEATTNYGIYATAKEATTNWAGYFADGNVFVENDLYVNRTINATNITAGKLIGSFDGNGSQLTDLNHSLQDAYDDGDNIEVGSIGYYNNLTIDLCVLGDPITPDRGVVFQMCSNKFIQISPTGFFSNLLDWGFTVANPTAPNEIFVQLAVIDEDTPFLYGKPRLVLRAEGNVEIEKNVTPYSDGGSDFGSPAKRWNNLYIKGDILGQETGGQSTMELYSSTGDVKLSNLNFNVTNNGSVVTSKGITASGNMTGSWGKFTNLNVSDTAYFSDLKIVGDLNVTGVSYLGDIIINADNLSVNDIIALNENISFFNNSKDKKMIITHYGRVGIGQTTEFDPRIGMSITGDFDLTHTATENDDHALEIIVDSAGYGDVKGIDLDYITGAISAGEEEEVILINIDESLATGGDVIAVDVLATEGSASIYGLEAGVLVNPVVQLSGTFEDMDSANNSGGNALTNFTVSNNDSLIFVDDNDYIIIGNANKFEEIEFLLNTSSSNPGIKPTFEYSTGVNTWGTFSPADGTNGMRNTGITAWFDSDIPAWATGSGSEYLIRINRTQNNLQTIPREDKVQISSATLYKWTKDGDLVINNINASGDLTMVGNLNVTNITTGYITTSYVCNASGSCFTLTELNATGGGGGATGLDSAYDVGENTITVDTDDVVWNLNGKDFTIQDDGDNVVNVSDGDLYFGNETGDQILIQDGSTVSPGIAFASQTNTGMWSKDPGSLNFLTAGTESIHIDSAGHLLMPQDGGRTLAAFAIGDSNTGLFRVSSDILAFTSGSIEFLRFHEPSSPNVAIFNDIGVDVDFRIETDTETDMVFIEGGTPPYINFAGGYGSTGVTINDSGDISMNGNLVIDGTCTSEGGDCSGDIAELTHSKASLDNTTCNVIDGHTETIIHNYYNTTNEECSYQKLGDYYEYVCINISERYEFDNISEICSDEYKEFEGGKFEKITTCHNETPIYYENETITIPKRVDCSLDENFELEFESGDVVCIDETDPQHIKFCDNAYDTSVVGVISYGATMIIGQRAPYPLSLSGNIPVKVICDTPINVGDILVSSSTEGYAQSFKTWQPTATWSDMQKVWEHTGSPFAKALEPCGGGTKTIRAWLS